MTSVLTLITEPTAGGLDHNIVAKANAALAALGAQTGAVDWLHPDVACDLPFDGVTPAAARQAVVAALDSQPVDVAAQARAGRAKKLLLADMDATMILEESLDELAALAGVGDEVVEITRQAMAGELDFAAALRARVALLAGKPAGLIASTLDRLTVRAGGRTLVRTMQANGAVTALVSGGFMVFVEPIADRLGFDHRDANVLEVQGEVITGRVADPILGGTHKETVLRRLAGEHRLGLDQTLAVGDGANDRFAVSAAGLGVALHGKPVLKAAADVAIDHGGLAGLLYVQGYRQAEFVD